MKVSLVPDSFIPLDKKSYIEKAENNKLEVIYEWLSSDIIAKLPLIHATTQDRAMKILESWYLFSHKHLVKIKSPAVSNNLHNNTDELDQIIWFDEYAFLSLWKWNIADSVSDLVYFCFNPESVWKIPWTIIVEKEIAELWACVSQEWAKHHINIDWFTEEYIQDRNSKAIEKFYDSIIVWETFEKLFPWFLKNHNMNIMDLIMGMSFPWEEVDKKKLTLDIEVVNNYWQWFQFMVPDKLPLKWNLVSIMTWEDVTNSKKIKSASKQFKNVRVTRQKDLLDTINSVGLHDGTSDNVVLRNFLLYLTYNNKLSVEKILNFIN